MGPNEKIFKKDYSKELLLIAENDLITSKLLSQSKEVRKETVLFHIEQVVEKSLKAVLCYKGRPIPFTQDLYSLIQRFDSTEMPPGGYSLHDLTPFATIKRYEEGNYIIDENDVVNALSAAENVLKWARQEMIE